MKTDVLWINAACWPTSWSTQAGTGEDSCVNSKELPFYVAPVQYPALLSLGDLHVSPQFSCVCAWYECVRGESITKSFPAASMPMVRRGLLMPKFSPLFVLLSSFLYNAMCRFPPMWIAVDIPYQNHSWVWILRTCAMFVLSDLSGQSVINGIRTPMYLLPRTHWNSLFVNNLIFWIN